MPKIPIAEPTICDSVRRASSADDLQNDKGHQIEQNDANLEDRHPGVVKGIELIARQMKPSTMKPLHPVVRKCKKQKPHEQYAEVDDRTPQENVARGVQCSSSILLLPKRYKTSQVLDAACFAVF